MGRPRKEYAWGEEIKNGIIFLEELEGIPINNNTTVERKVKVKCPRCGKAFITLLRKITRTSNNIIQCQECSNKDRVKRCKENGEKRAVNLLGQKFGKLTVVERVYQINSHGTMWKCKCDCGKEKIVSSSHLISNHTISCGCVKSKGEALIRNILDDLNINYYQQYIFQNCKDIRPLPFDFYLPSYNCCIEYDGIQHFKPCNNWDFNLCQKHDNIKNKYCENNNIKLIRIPYYNYNKLNKEYLLKLL